MAISVNSSGSWVEIPQQPEKIWVFLGGSWQPATEVWASEEVSIGNFDWVRVWMVVADLPDGVSVSLQQTQFSGGDVEASWSNPSGTGDYSIVVEWEINGNTWSFDTYGPGTQTAYLSENAVNNNDEVRARMRYFVGSVEGDWGPWSSVLFYTDSF